MALAVEFSFGIPLEDGHLLVAVMRVHRHLGADRKSRDSGGDVLGAELLGNERRGSDAVAAVDRRQRVDFQNMRIGHGRISFRKAVSGTLTAPLTARQAEAAGSSLRVLLSANDPEFHAEYK